MRKVNKKLVGAMIASAMGVGGAAQAADIWIGAPGWASTNVEKIRAKSYGYDTTMDLLEMDETLAWLKWIRRSQKARTSYFSAIRHTTCSPCMTWWFLKNLHSIRPSGISFNRPMIRTGWKNPARP